MTGDWARRHREWIDLRTDLRRHTKEKAWSDVVTTCSKIIRYASANPDLGIVAWMHLKKAANALDKLGQYEAAITWMTQAIEGCKKYRAMEKLASPEDFLKDIGVMEGKVAMYRKKLAKAAK